jgi:D-methionine transport system substrate-binding protein
MKKTILLVSALLGLTFTLGACQKANTTLTVGATSVPHAEILAVVKEDLAKEGVELVIQEFGDYTLINEALSQGQIDANYFQHTPFLESYVANSGNKLVGVAKIHIEPLGIYSDKYEELSEIPDGASIGIPNDETNEGRALLLLQSAGLITLKQDAGLEATPASIESNPKNLNFVELDAAILPRTLSDTDASIINTNYVLEATELNPVEDALAMEGSDSPFANVVAVNEADKDSEVIKKLITALTSQKVKDFINEEYKGAVVPVF